MNAGKLDASALLSRVFPYTGNKREEVILRSAIGEDSAAIALDEWCCVFSSDPITGAVSDSGWLAVHVSCNDVASNGAEPVGVMLTILMPEKATDEDVEKIMQSADRAAKELGIEIFGGHTEFTGGLVQPILCATAVGKVKKGDLVTSSGARPGDDIVLTKGAGIEGTAILATDYEHYLQNVIPNDLLQNAKNFMQWTSVVQEGLLAAKLGASAMHDVTEGGVLGALFEVAEASGVGIEVNKECIPLFSETKAICDVVGIDPLKLISSGAMLITIRNGKNLVGKLQAKGIKAAVIGKVVAGNRKVLLDGEQVVEINKPESDELWRAKKIIEKASAK
jgi:hydrogenase maturation factor